MEFSKKILPGGLRLITIPMPASPTVTVMVLAETGSKYETKEISGISHFLEHAMFKGTFRRPKPADISRELDALGAQYNAFTGQEFTGYYAKAHKDKTAKILDIIADMYVNPALPEAELEKEKGVIVQEINMYEDEPMRHVQDVFMELVYGNQPAGWNIAGTKETVTGFKVEDVRAYHTNRYVSAATVVVVSGGFDEAEIERKITELFSPLSQSPKRTKVPVSEAQQKPAVSVAFKDTDQAHIVLGVRAFGIFDPRLPIIKVLSGVLSGGMSSRLFTKLRDELGLCYYVSASPDLYTDHGLLGVSAGVDIAKIDPAISAILAELKRLADAPVPADELRKVKDFLIGNMYLGLESSDELGQFVGFQEVLGRPLKKPEDIVAEIEKVSAEDISRVAKELFVSSQLNLAVVGPFKDSGQFLSLLTF